MQKFMLIFAVLAVSGVAAEDAEEVAGLYVGSEKFDDFGSSVSVWGETAIVGAHGDDSFGEDAGAAYIFSRRGGDWTLDAVLKADDIAAGDNFGVSVEISGDLAIVGADSKLDGELGKGAAYIFNKSSGSWVQEAKLLGADAHAGDRFGTAVAITEEGYALVGAVWHSKNLSVGSVQNHGAAYVYFKDGSSWMQQAKLLADDFAQNDRFGGAVSIDGSIVVVGAREADDVGAAYVFERNGSAWGQQAKLEPHESNSTGVQFGSSVSVSGSALVVGAYWDDELAVNAGAAYVFTRNSDTGKWDEGAKLMSPDGSNEERFGSDVNVHGNTVVIGSEWDNDNGVWHSGSAYIWHQRSLGEWSFQEKLVWSNASKGDTFGKAVGVWDSGFGPFTCLVGVPAANWSVVFEGGIPTTTTTSTTTTATNTSTTTITSTSSSTSKTESSTSTSSTSSSTTSVSSTVSSTTTSSTTISITSTTSSTATSTSHTGTSTSATATSTTSLTHTTTSETLTSSTSTSGTNTTSTATLTTATTTSHTVTTSTDTTATTTQTTETKTTSTATTFTLTSTTSTSTTSTSTTSTSTTSTSSSSTSTTTSLTNTSMTSTATTSTTTYTTATSTTTFTTSYTETSVTATSATFTSTTNTRFLVPTSLPRGSTDEDMNHAPSSKLALTALVLVAIAAGLGGE